MMDEMEHVMTDFIGGYGSGGYFAEPAWSGDWAGGSGFISVATPKTGGDSPAAGLSLPGGIQLKLPSSIKIGSSGSSVPTNRDKVVDIVNWYEAQMQENLASYQGGERNITRQTAALQQFDTLWSEMQTELSSYGGEGSIAWTTRQRGGQYPWEVYYRDPIKADSKVAGGIGGVVSDTVASLSAGKANWVVWVGIAVIGFFAVRKAM
jgi:hypothetical protein